MQFNESANESENNEPLIASQSRDPIAFGKKNLITDDLTYSDKMAFLGNR